MKTLVLLSRIPWPLEKGDKLRAYHHIKAISQNHEVVLVCLNDQTPHPKAYSELSKFCSEIHFIKLSKLKIIWNLILTPFSDKPFQVNYFFQKSAQKKVQQIVARVMPKHLFVQLIRTAEYAKDYSFIPSSFDYMDAFSTGAERRISKAIPGLRWLLKIESGRLKNYENQVFNKFTHKYIISKNDRDLITHPDKNQINILPNGVDFNLFSPKPTEIVYDLVFTGNMSYPPNIKAAQFISKNILPLLLPKFPNIKILIAGANPAASVKKLANKNIIVSGWLDKITDAYNQSKIFVAPMEIGTGMQNKILEAMAMRIPCVTSPLAASAIGASANNEVLIAQTPEEFAAHISQLLASQSIRTQIAQKANVFVKHNFNWEINTQKLVNSMN